MKAVLNTTKEYYKYSSANVNRTGSPTVNNNGIASGFSSSNFLTLPEDFAPGSRTWEIVFKIDSATTATGEYFVLANSSSRGYLPSLTMNYASGFSLFLTNNTSGWSICSLRAMEMPTQYPVWVRWRFTSSQYDISYSYDNANYSIKNSQSSTTAYNGSLSKIGYGTDSGDNSNKPFNGTIDLKESYIKIGGGIWWQGAFFETATELDYYKSKDVKKFGVASEKTKKYFKYGNAINAATVGSPTVSNGVASGFSSSNFLINPSLIFTTSQLIETVICFSCTDTNSDQSIVHNWASDGLTNLIEFGVGNGYIRCYNFNNSTHSNLFSIQPNVKYWVKQITNNNVKSYSYSIDGINYISSPITSSVVKVNDKLAQTGLTLGCNTPYYGAPFTSGSIDLKQCYIKVNDVEIWHGTFAEESTSSDYDFYKEVTKTYAIRS